MKKKILLVDDNPDIQTVFSIGLESQGFHVLTANTGQSALAQMASFQPDFAIVDYGLPDVDGITVGQQMKQHPHGTDTQMILFSGRHNPELAERAAAAGFSEFLVKPIRMDSLLEKLQPKI